MKRFIKEWGPGILILIVVFGITLAGHYFFWDHVLQYPHAGKIMLLVAIASFAMMLTTIIYAILKNKK